MKYQDKGLNIKIEEKKTDSETVTQLPIFTNVTHNAVNDQGVQQYPLTVKTRAWVFSDWIDDKHSEGIGGAYKYYAYTWLAIAGAIIFAFINPWIAGVFAFLAGYCRGERIIHQAWYKLWFSSKSYLITK
ncbi:Uncharacterised protein [uncultured archaeon]|nr:Uncharacterised protein [uncultured archaeon]